MKHTILQKPRSCLVSKFSLNFAFLCATLMTVIVLPSGHVRAQEATCKQPQIVCEGRSAVFPISAFDPVGSAVRISDTVLVTSRHVVADETDIDVFLPDGKKIKAKPIPTDYKGDVILLSAPDLPAGPILVPADTRIAATVHTIGADVSFGRIRAYDPGKIKLLPAAGKPLARLHHTAYNQPGNSGGALVDENGKLVGIIASGGEGRLEAVPANVLDGLKQRSGPDHAEANAEIGAAIRICTLKLDEARSVQGALEEQDAKAIGTSCRRTGNRQFFDLAAQAFGSRRMIDESLALFEASLDQDPNSLNGRLGLAITYHFAARYEEELPHLRFLRQHLPEDLQVLRLAIQAGIWGDDPEFAQSAFDTLKKINPKMAPAAERFLKSPPPRPPRR